MPIPVLPSTWLTQEIPGDSQLALCATNRNIAKSVPLPSKQKSQYRHFLRPATIKVPRGPPGRALGTLGCSLFFGRGTGIRVAASVLNGDHLCRVCVLVSMGRGNEAARPIRWQGSPSLFAPLQEPSLFMHTSTPSPQPLLDSPRSVIPPPRRLPWLLHLEMTSTCRLP